MTDQVRQLAPQIWQEISISRHILLICHPKPDPDSIGGVLALRHLLIQYGIKTTAVMGDSPPPPSLSVLPGFAQIETRNWFDLNLDEYDLLICQDIAGIEQISKLGQVVFPSHLRVVVIDHHATNSKFGTLNLVEPDYPAACQIIYELSQLWPVNLSPEAAGCLYLGIFSDSVGLSIKTVSPDTLKCVAELVRINPEVYRVLEAAAGSLSPADNLHLGLCLTHVENFFSNQVSISVLPYSLLAEHGLSGSFSSPLDVANQLKLVAGVLIGVRFSESEPGLISLSLRSRDPDKYDVSRIASTVGHGGGHKAAAGATLTMPFDEAKQLLLSVIKNTYPELGEP